MLAACLLLFTNRNAAQVVFHYKGARASRSLHSVFIRNLPIINCTLNGQGPYYFILDSGAGLSLLTDSAVARQLGLVLSGESMIYGIGDTVGVKVSWAQGINFNIQDIVTSKRSRIPVLLSDSLGLADFVGMPVHGILGMDFFNSFPIGINYRGLSVKVYRPGSAPDTRGYNPLPMRIIRNMLFLEGTATMNDGIPQDLQALLLDTGSGNGLTIFGDKLKLAAKTPVIYNFLGTGIGGDIYGYQFRTNQFVMGPNRFTNILTCLPDLNYREPLKNFHGSIDGSIGSGLLEPFSMIINCKDSTLYLRQLASILLNEGENLTGFEHMYDTKEQNSLRIIYVLPGSDADKLGIHTNDHIIGINNKRVSELSSRQISEMFNHEGIIVELELQRGDKTELKTIRLKKYI
jgi:hypothetical protein